MAIQLSVPPPFLEVDAPCRARFRPPCDAVDGETLSPNAGDGGGSAPHGAKLVLLVNGEATTQSFGTGGIDGGGNF